MRRLHALARWVGVDRSMLIRRLIALGHPRMRELRAHAVAGRGPRALALRAAVRGLERGILMVRQGHAGGLLLSMRHLPLSHAHLGSLAFGSLETGVQEAMVRHLGAGDVFYDVGANVGFFALLGVRLVGPQGRVYAFEAAPDNVAAIRANVALNRIENVEVVAGAVGARDGRARLQVVDDQSWSKLEEYGPHPGTEQVLEVEMFSLDSLIASGRVAPPALVKIDVEGAEIAVLEGMAETIARHAPAIVCELHDTGPQFVALMAGHGYRLVNLDGPEAVESAPASVHVLALPAGSDRE